MNNKPIKSRRYYVLEVELISPLNVSGSESENTDKDVLKNAQGIPFVPGTSIAGALRAALNIDVSAEKVNSDAEIFGYHLDQEGRMSTINVSDLYFDNSFISVRDGIELVNRQVKDKSKYDVEIIETGAKGKIYIDCVIRDVESEEYDRVLKLFVSRIQSGLIRFGAKKNRGFGRLKINNIYVKKFSKVNVLEYLQFDKFDLTKYDKDSETILTEEKVYDDYINIKVPLNLTGGICIRKYSTRPNEADYEHVTIYRNGKRIPVIPGTSWNGAIRADALKILKALGYKNAEDVIKHWFGYIEKNMPKTENKKDGKDIIKSWSSRVVINESIIKDSVGLNVTRNRIDRYDASAVDGALYTERAYFGGHLKLELQVRKDDHNIKYNINHKALIGLLTLVIRDLQKGYLPVGGLVSVGRGIMKGAGAIEYSEGNADDYLKELSDFISQGAEEA